ncbi:MAG: acetoin utilization protein AcuC [Thiohalomonadales bacterium]
MKNVSVYIGEKLARYGFGAEHPFGTDRMAAFWDYAVQRGITKHVIVNQPVDANEQQILLFHSKQYLKHVQKCSREAKGYIDSGDTPAVKGIYEAALTVVGTTLDAVSNVMNENIKRAFVPIAGLHHATRNNAAGFCVFNDCGIAIEFLRKNFGIKRIAYVDIDAHHGDGVFYAFESDPELIFADIHEDGKTLYPGTGANTETGLGGAIGTKLNIPVKADSNDRVFMDKWLTIEAFIIKHKPEFIIFQCGADSIAGDPITHLQFSIKAHSYAAKRLCELADDLSAGRLIVLGGGGYNRTNIAQTWTAVVEALISHS